MVSHGIWLVEYICLLYPWNGTGVKIKKRRKKLVNACAQSTGARERRSLFVQAIYVVHERPFIGMEGWTA